MRKYNIVERAAEPTGTRFSNSYAESGPNPVRIYTSNTCISGIYIHVYTVMSFQFVANIVQLHLQR